MKKIILLIIIGILFMLLCNGCFFFGEKPLLETLENSTFEVVCDKPIYYYKPQKKELYYSANGSINSGKLIWKGYVSDREDVFVSPNSQYILVRNKFDLILMDNTGKILKTISPYAYRGEKEIYNSSEKPKFTSIWGQDPQWLKDSSGFFIKKHKYNENIKALAESNKWDSKLFFVPVSDEGSTVILQDIWSVSSFAASKSKDKLLYKEPTPEGDVVLKIHIIGDDQKNDQLISNEDVNLNNWFFNFKTSFFGGSFSRWNYDNSYGIIVDKDLLVVNNEGIKKTLIKVRKEGATSKNYSYTFNLNNSYFLPGNRFFTTYISSKKYDGQVIIDVINSKLMFIEDRYFFFSITTDNVSDYSLGGYKLIKPNRLTRFEILKLVRD